MNRKEFELQYGQYLLFDDPIPYKDLLIYPAKMEDYVKFNSCIQSISIDKNSVVINNPIMIAKVIGMSYLDFLFLTSDSEVGIYNLSCMFNLLSMCLHISLDDISYPEGIDKNYFLSINNSTIDKFDFDNIRKIICYQNLIDLPEDDLTPPALKEKLKEAQEFQNKHKKKMGNLEDQIICLMISMDLSLDTIKNMSIRKFEKALSRVDYKMHYEIYKEAECSGMVKFKEEITHWMCDLTVEDKYSDVKVDFEKFKNESGLHNVQVIDHSKE